MTNQTSFRRLALFSLFVMAGAVLIAQAPRTGVVPTERIFAALGIKEGATVGEIGAGSGELSIAAAKVVGTTGKVYTSELGDERVKTLEANIKKSGLDHITVVTGDPNETNFADGCCDAIFMRNVYHHFADPSTMNASIFRSLKPGGRVAVVDFIPTRGNKEAAKPAARANNDSHGVSAASVARELKEAGFADISDEPGDERWFMVVARKPQ